MGSTTGISWTDATWNPVRGCSRVSEGCRHCYAETTAARFSGPGLAYEGLAKRVGGEPRWTGEVRFVEEHLADPLRWQEPRRIFVNSMSDLFHGSLSDEQIALVFAVMAVCRKHTFQVLTKRPERAREWFRWAQDFETDDAWQGPLRALWEAICTTPAPFPARYERLWEGEDGPDVGTGWPLPNVWLGVSCEDQAAAEERIPLLLQCPAAVRWVSAEPLLGPVDFTCIEWWRDDGSDYFDALTRARPDPDDVGINGAAIDWVVVGGESGKGARPCDVAWIRSIRDQCAAASVPCFVKQLGSRPVSGIGRDRLPLEHPRGEHPEEWPADLRVREFPQERQVAA